VSPVIRWPRPCMTSVAHGFGARTSNAGAQGMTLGQPCAGHGGRPRSRPCRREIFAERAGDNRARVSGSGAPRPWAERKRTASGREGATRRVDSRIAVRCWGPQGRGSEPGPYYAMTAAANGAVRTAQLPERATRGTRPSSRAPRFEWWARGRGAQLRLSRADPSTATPRDARASPPRCRAEERCGVRGLEYRSVDPGEPPCGSPCSRPRPRAKRIARGAVGDRTARVSPREAAAAGVSSVPHGFGPRVSQRVEEVVMTLAREPTRPQAAYLGAASVCPTLLLSCGPPRARCGLLDRIPPAVSFNSLLGCAFRAMQSSQAGVHVACSRGLLTTSP